jgi:hypothetical protein
MTDPVLTLGRDLPDLEIQLVSTNYAGGPRNDIDLSQLIGRITNWIVGPGTGLLPSQVPQKLKEFIGDTGNPEGIEVICDARVNPPSQECWRILVMIAVAFDFPKMWTYVQESAGGGGAAE